MSQPHGGREPVAVAAAGEGWGLDRVETRRRAVELLERVGLRVDPDTPVERLSTGEEQLVRSLRPWGAGRRFWCSTSPPVRWERRRRRGCSI